MKNPTLKELYEAINKLPRKHQSADDFGHEYIDTCLLYKLFQKWGVHDPVEPTEGECCEKCKAGTGKGWGSCCKWDCSCHTKAEKECIYAIPLPHEPSITIPPIEPIECNCPWYAKISWRGGVQMHKPGCQFVSPIEAIKELDWDMSGKGITRTASPPNTDIITRKINELIRALNRLK